MALCCLLLAMGRVPYDVLPSHGNILYGSAQRVIWSLPLEGRSPFDRCRKPCTNKPLRATQLDFNISEVQEEGDS